MISQLKKTIKGKIKKSEAFTLSEILMVVLVLSLATGVLAGSVYAGVGTFAREKNDSNGQELCNALAVAIEDELRYAMGIEGGGTAFTYSSRSRAGEKDCALFVDENGRIKIKDSEGTQYLLVNDSMYGNTFTSDLDAKWEEGVFTVTVSVSRKTADANVPPVTQRTFTVSPLND